jgi:hypothetical protein
MITTRTTTDAMGVWEEKLQGETVVGRVLVTPSAGWEAQEAPRRTASATQEAKRVTSRTRLETLARKAALHAKNTGNPALTTRELNEMVARLYFADKADDQ